MCLAEEDTAFISEPVNIYLTCRRDLVSEIKLRTLVQRGIILDYLDGPSLITGIFNSEEFFSSVVSGRCGHEGKVREMGQCRL